MKNRGSGFEQQPGQVQQVYSDAAGKTASGQRSVLAGYNPYSAVEQEHYYTADQYQQYNFQLSAAKYFIMKCGNQRNIDESVQTGFWQTSVGLFFDICAPPPRRVWQNLKIGKKSIILGANSLKKGSPS